MISNYKNYNETHNKCILIKKFKENKQVGGIRFPDIKKNLYKNYFVGSKRK